MGLFEGILSKYEGDSMVKSSAWRSIRREWIGIVEGTRKLIWWRNELAQNGDRLGEGRGGVYLLRIGM